MSKMQSIIRKLEHAVKSQKEELERQAKEFEESKTQNDLLQRALKDKIEKVSVLVYKMPGTCLCKYMNWKPLI